MEEFIVNDGNERENPDIDFNEIKQEGAQPVPLETQLYNENYNDGENEMAPQPDLFEEYFKEREAKLETEFSYLADYTVITKLLQLIRKERIHTNEKVINESVEKFLKRICKWLNAEWIFYQVDYLIIFNELL